MVKNHQKQNKQQNQHFDKINSRAEERPENLCLPKDLVLPSKSDP